MSSHQQAVAAIDSMSTKDLLASNSSKIVEIQVLEASLLLQLQLQLQHTNLQEHVEAMSPDAVNI